MRQGQRFASRAAAWLHQASWPRCEVIRALTDDTRPCLPDCIVATVFMALTMVAGIHAMDFNPEFSVFNMPDVSWHYALPFARGLMALLGAGFLLLLGRRGRLGAAR